MPNHLFIPALVNGRRLAISDIHGCNTSFNSLLEKIKLTLNDQLFLLGDFINRGGDSLGVIKTVRKLQDDGYHVYFLRGNHNFYLVHAGFDFKAEKPLKMYNKMLTIRKFSPDYNKVAQKLIIHGHIRHSLKKIQNNITSDKSHFSIDNGCSAKRFTGQGNLVCLNLDTKELIVQPNID